MGRNINFDKIEFIIKWIKEKFNDSVIRTSIITGFPGETEKDYLILKERLLNLPIDYLNVFAYSDMQKAPSFKLKNKVKPEIAIERRNDLINSFEETLKNRLKRFIGTTDEIYIEGEDENYYIGRIWVQTPDLDGLTYIYKDDKSKKIVELNKNKKIKVKISDTFFYDFYGEII
jgi:ribosomal protein S12 methylthiotransferase